MSVAMMNAALDSGVTANQTFTHGTATFDAVAAIFYVGRATVDGTVTAESAISIGFTDGTQDLSISVAGDDGVSTSDAARRYNTNNCLMVTAAGGTGLSQGLASFVNFTKVGGKTSVTVNITNDFAAGYLCTIVFIGNANVDVQSKAMSTTSAVAVDVGFKPDLVFALTYNENSATGFASSAISYGIIYENGGTPIQKQMNWYERDNQSVNTHCKTYIGNAAGAGQMDNTGGDAAAIDYTISFGDFQTGATANFDMTPSSDAGTDLIALLSIEFTDTTQIALVDYDSPTSAVVDSITGAGFTPEFCQVVMAAGHNRNEINKAAGEDGVTICNFTDSVIWSHTWSSEESVALGTTVAKNVASSNFRLLESGSTNNAVATFDSFNSDGADLDYSVAPSTTANVGWALFLGAGGSDVVIEVLPGGTPY
jgi:hypothetical protein